MSNERKFHKIKWLIKNQGHTRLEAINILTNLEKEGNKATRSKSTDLCDILDLIKEFNARWKMSAYLTDY